MTILFFYLKITVKPFFMKGETMAVLTTRETMVRFGIKSPTTVLQLFATKGSPAWKVSRGWMVDEEDFKKFLQKESDKYKS